MPSVPRITVDAVNTPVDACPELGLKFPVAFREALSLNLSVSDIFDVNGKSSSLDSLNSFDVSWTLVGVK
jgi:hypothetical protein